MVFVSSRWYVQFWGRCEKRAVIYNLATVKYSIIKVLCKKFERREEPLKMGSIQLKLTSKGNVKLVCVTTSMNLHKWMSQFLGTQKITIVNKLFTKSYLKVRFSPVERKVQLSSTQERSTPGQAERHVKKRNINWRSS